MKAGQIFVHSVRQVFGNMEGALRVSAVLYLVLNGVGLLLLVQVIGFAGLSDQKAAQQAMATGGFPWAQFAVALLIEVIGGLWIAVGWHRFVLLNEMPQLIPTLKTNRIAAYFLRGLWIAVILIPVGVAFALGISLVAVAVKPNPSNFNLFALIPLIVGLPVWAIALRLSAALPGAALGAEGGVGDAWRATKDDWSTFLMLAVLLAGVSFLSGVAETVLAGSQVLSLIWQFGFGWVSLMVGVSILTTLYGHYIEKRPLI